MQRGLERVAAATLLFAGLWGAASPASAQLPANLTGVWADDNGKRVAITQNGASLTLTAPDGKMLTGQTTNSEFSLAREFAPSEISPTPPPEVQAAVSALHLQVTLVGTVDAAKRTISATETLPNDIRWNSDFRITSITKEAVKVRLTAKQFYKLRWLETPETNGNRLALTGPNGQTFDRPIAGVKYEEKGSVSLAAAADCGPCNDPDSSYVVERIEVHNLLGAPGPIAYQGSDLPVTRNADSGESIVKLDVDGMLHGVVAGVNLNVLEATATLRLGGSNLPLTVRSSNLAHVLRQKLLVFIPGVLGSSLYVRRNPARGNDAIAKCMMLPSGTERDNCLNGEEVEAFPKFSRGVIPEGAGSYGTQYLRLLADGRDGRPSPGAEATKIDLFRSFGVDEGSTMDTSILSGVGRCIVPDSLVYGIEKLDAVTAPPDHPKLTINDQPAPYYIFQPWPFDWRGRLEEQVDLFMGADDGRASVDPPYGAPPSIQAIVRAKKLQYPFLADKVALVGHSTGGLIIRGILVREGIGDYVDKAAFIDVPFFGAPKAYFVYLTGDMSVAFLGREQMILLAPNMPILYYLAPNQYYPLPVAVVDQSPRFRLHSGAGDIMRGLLDEAARNRLYRLPSSSDAAWNDDLEFAADIYFIDVYNKTPKIDFKNLLVFVSELPASDPNPSLCPPSPPNPRAGNAPTVGLTVGDTRTVGRVRITSNAVVYDSVPGDGTVPLVSQRGDLATHQEVQFKSIPGGPPHTHAPNQPYVWETIIRAQTVNP